MADVSILLPDASAPTGYTVPSTSEIIPKSASAIIDGTSATAAFYPVLEIVSDGGHVVAQARAAAVAAGGSAEVSWFPGVKQTLSPTASCYLWTKTSKTFTGNVGFVCTWDHFQTTDTTVFGTNLLPDSNEPPHNTAGDSGIILLQAGAYIAEASVEWASGTAAGWGAIQLVTADYVDDQAPTPAENVSAATVPWEPVSGANMSQSTKAFTVVPGDEPGVIDLLAEGQGVTAYTVTSYSMVIHWLGGGLGTDVTVY